MSSTPERVQTLIDEVASVSSQVTALLAAIGQGQFDPAYIQAQIEAATQGAIDSVMAQLEGLDVTELAARSELQRRILNLINGYDPSVKFCFEFFNDLYTIADTISVSGIVTVAGDDSVDVDSTSGLVSGREYVLEDGNGTQQAVVQVKSILSATRFTCLEEIPVSISGGRLRRTNWTFANGTGSASNGKVYYSVPVDLDASVLTAKALVIRRTASSQNPRVYFRGEGEISWREALWEWYRDSSYGFPSGAVGGDSGFVDVEYRVPCSGSVEFKIVAQDPVTVKHIVGVSRDTHVQGNHRPPNTPSIASPAAGAIGIRETPTVGIAAYSHPVGTAQGAIQVQISTVNGSWVSPNIVHDSGEAMASVAYSVPAGVLAVSTDYFVRARVKDSEGAWSSWSASTGFRTHTTFAVPHVATPVNSAPVNGAINVSPTPTLVGAGFSFSGGTGTHTASEWQVTEGGDFTAPVFASGEDSTHKVSIALGSSDSLDPSKTYYWRVRYKGDFGAEGVVWSEWSVPTAFKVQDIIGICYVGSKEWNRVGSDGNPLVTDTAFFSSHATYAGITDVTIDGQAMVKIPRFYVKVGPAPSGSVYAGKTCWWLSSYPMDGFHLHPAFMVSGVAVDQFYIGKYLGSNNSGMIESKAGVLPYNSLIADSKAKCEARNTGGVTGFGLWDIYQVMAMQYLILVELGGPEIRSKIGSGLMWTPTYGASNAGDVYNVDSASRATASWRGIVGIWDGMSTFVDGLYANHLASGDLYIWDRLGNKTWVNTGKRLFFTGWMTGFNAESGTSGGKTWDFSDLFFPDASAVTTNSNLAASMSFAYVVWYPVDPNYGDNRAYTDSHLVMFGMSPVQDYTETDLFNIQVTGEGHGFIPIRNHNYHCRLSKV